MRDQKSLAARVSEPGSDQKKNGRPCASRCNERSEAVWSASRERSATGRDGARRWNAPSGDGLACHAVSGIVRHGRKWSAGRGALRDASWIAAGSVVAAIGALLGLRLITEVAPLDVFGAFVLANGVLALAGGVALQPVAQAGLRVYPDLALRGDPGQLRHLMAERMLRRIAGVAAVGLVAAVIDHLALGWLSPLSWILLIATLVVDAGKTVEVVLRNAGGDQIGYAALGAIDAWARPLVAAMLAFGLQPSVEILLFGQLVGAGLVAATFTRAAPRPRCARHVSWRHDLERLAAPLGWIPIVGWVTSLADRYVLAAVLGTAAAGVYAAAYGLVSRPMLMLGGITDASLRQRLYDATARRDEVRRRRVEIAWLSINGSLGLSIVLVFVAAGDWIVALALAPDYRSGVLSLLLPLGLGHVAVLAYQAVVRRLYAAGHTGRVLVADGTAAVVAVVGALLGALLGGVRGAAWAMPVYGAVQLGLVLTLARSVR